MQNSASNSINKSPLNNSKSKQCFTFSKSPKKEKIKTNNHSIYDIPSMMSKRATGMGFGKKSSLGPLNTNPSPDKYEKSSDFEKSPKKGISFGISREDFKSLSIFRQVEGPGPCDYNNTAKQSQKNMFQIRGRDGFPKIFNQSKVPGPGHYQIKQYTDKQFYAESRRKSPFNFTIKKSKDNNNKQNSLGPGAYQTSLASMGRQVLANKKTQKCCSFSKQSRETMPLIRSSVGPGSYHHFSQFGK